MTTVRAGPSIVRAGPSGRRAVALDATGCPALDVPPCPSGRRVAGPSVALPSGAGPSVLGVPGLDATGGDLRPLAYGRPGPGRCWRARAEGCRGCRAVRVSLDGCPSFGVFGMEGIGFQVVG